MRFRKTSNCWKRVIETAKLAHANKPNDSITSKELDSHDFWEIANSVLNNGKPAMPIICREVQSPEKTQSYLQSQFPPEITLLPVIKSQENIQTHLKSNFMFTPNLKYMLQKVLKMTGVKLTIGRLSLIGIYWYQSTNRFIISHLFMYSHKGGLTIDLMIIYKQIWKLHLKLHLKTITSKIYAKSWNSN